MSNNCKYHGWQDTDNEPCPYCIIDQLRTAFANMTEVARLAQEAAATAETRAVTRCVEIASNLPSGYSGEIRNGADVAAMLIKKEYGL